MRAAPASASTLKPGPDPSNRLNRLEGSVESTEIWKSFPGYEGLYEVSDQGRVRGVERLVKTKNGVRLVSSRILRPCVRAGSGHHQVSLSVGGKSTSHRVHKLVLEAFHGPRPFPEAVGRHLNGVESDNRAENLRWGTVTENNRDIRWHVENRGSVRPTESIIPPALAGMVARHMSDAEIAAELGVTSHTVFRWRKAEKIASDYRPSKVPHGKPSRYTHHGCRCDACRAAHSEYQRVNKRWGES